MLLSRTQSLAASAPELPKTIQATARPPNSPPASMYRMNAGRVLGVRGLSLFRTRNCARTPRADGSIRQSHGTSMLLLHGKQVSAGYDALSEP